jgi:hypothetical protein
MMGAMRCQMMTVMYLQRFPVMAHASQLSPQV